MVPRVRTMGVPAATSSPLPAIPSGPWVTSGSSALTGTKTVPLPPLVILSRPWSKNWPKIVKSELNGGDSPTSVVTLGMSSVWRSGTHATGSPSGPMVGGVVQTTTPSLPWDRTGNPAAATAAGFVEVWSTIRLLTMRGSESTTEPAVCA